MLLSEYSADWPTHFRQIVAQIAPLFAGSAVGFVHVGSTAIVGLMAKPIIDVDLFYNHTESFDTIKDNLESIGYRHHGNQGIAAREVFKRSGQQHNEFLDSISHHLYVCPVDSPELRRHLLFKYALVNDQLARTFYGNLKLQLAAESGQDRKVYAQLKALKAQAFIDYLIEKAAGSEHILAELNQVKSV